MPSQADVISQCESEDIRLVRLLYVGNDGIIRGHTVDADRIADSFEYGENLATVVQSLTATDVVAPAGQFGAVGEVRLLPEAATFHTLPYAERTAAMLCTLQNLDGSPWAADPRSRLKEFLDTQVDRGLKPRVALESEFYLLEDEVAADDAEAQPVDDSPCYAATGMQNVHDVVLATFDALDAQGISVDAYHPELGPGQQELIPGHASGIDAIDEYLFLRRTVRAVAREYGLDASFAPKPMADAPGSGCHIHLSLWSEGENVFFESAQDQPYSLSETGRNFVGGLLEHAPGLIALTAASVASYKRLKPQSWASAYICFGADNREALVRIPSADQGRRAATTRIEFKPADHTANPYLSLLGILAAGLDGIENNIDPGDAVEVDPVELDASERSARGIERLPETFGTALDALEADDVLMDALGDTLSKSYLAVKRAQCESSGSREDDPGVDSVLP